MTRNVSFALGLLWLLAAPAHGQTDPQAVFACERAYGEARHADAARLCRPLAEAGSADAQAIMGTLYQSGQGVSRDYGEAARWFNLAARQGHVVAQFNLGALYNYGAGVNRDPVEAYVWYELAANAGNSDAAAGRALLSRNLTAAQIDQARSRAADLYLTMNTAAEPTETAVLPPSSGEAGTDLQAMVDQLRTITDRATRDRSGDYRLLQQLRDLAGRYDRPWRFTLLNDNFADGNFTANPIWTVASGRFSVDARYGLRNRVAPPTRIDFGSGSQSDSEAAVKLFGAILGAVTKKQTGTTGQQASRAEIYSRRVISDAFSAEVEVGAFTKAVEGGGFEFGVYRGARRDSGYRLIYSQGAAPSLTLVRLSPGGVSTIARTALAKGLEDRAYHRLTLRRGADGAMDALLDGATVMTGNDRVAVSQPFEGLTIVNRGGEFAFRNVIVMGSGQ